MPSDADSAIGAGKPLTWISIVTRPTNEVSIIETKTLCSTTIGECDRARTTHGAIEIFSCATSNALPLSWTGPLRTGDLSSAATTCVATNTKALTILNLPTLKPTVPIVSVIFVVITSTVAATFTLNAIIIIIIVMIIIFSAAL